MGILGVYGLPVATDKIRVETVHRNVQNLPTANQEKFITVDFIPEEPDPVKGKKNVLFINPTTKEMWYEQKDRPINSEEAMADLATALATQTAEQNAKLDQLIQLQTEANDLQKSV